MYGGFAKTPEMLAADEKFLSDIRQIIQKDGRTMAQVSDHFVTRGWEAHARRDFATAMKRFNQAWLVDADNGDAYHGFALVVIERDKNAREAEGLFRQSIAKPRQSPGVYVDFGRFLLIENKPAEALPPLLRASAIPNISTEAFSLLAEAQYKTRDFSAACANAAKVEGDAHPDLQRNARWILGTPHCQKK